MSRLRKHGNRTSVTVRASTDYERSVDALLLTIADLSYRGEPNESAEDKLLGLENWAEAVQEQAERVRWQGILESVSSNQVRRE